MIYSGLCIQRKPRSAWASAQADRGIYCLLTESTDHFLSSLNLVGPWGTTDNIEILSLHFDHSSVVLCKLVKPGLVHSLMLSIDLSFLFCLPFILVLSNVPCRIVFAIPEECELCLLFWVFISWPWCQRSLWTPVISGICLCTSSLVMWFK